MDTKIFSSIDYEKQQRIINAAFEEFATKGYKQATTDSIVEKAGISKGALFKYFGCKENLLLYLCDYGYEVLWKAYSDNMPTGITDFLELYSLAIKVKFNIINQYPSLYNFMTMLFTGGTGRTDEWLSEKQLFANKYNANSMTDFDRTKFKDGVDIDMAVNVVRLTFDGLMNEVIAKLKADRNSIEIDEIHKKCDNYIMFFKKIFYREEF